MTLSNAELAIALRALDRKPYSERVPIDAIRSAHANSLELALSNETAAVLREALDSGLAAGIFTPEELPIVRGDFYAIKAPIVWEDRHNSQTKRIAED